MGPPMQKPHDGTLASLSRGEGFSCRQVVRDSNQSRGDVNTSRLTADCEPVQGLSCPSCDTGTRTGVCGERTGSIPVAGAFIVDAGGRDPIYRFYPYASQHQ